MLGFFISPIENKAPGPPLAQRNDLYALQFPDEPLVVSELFLTQRGH